jgi:hypothetical protein
MNSEHNILLTLVGKANNKALKIMSFGMSIEICIEVPNWLMLES